jgi:hypothetical protein
MAAPNVVNVSTIIGKTASLRPANTSANVLLANAESSDRVLKINSIVVANVTGTGAANATIAINSAANGSGTSQAIASTIAVPANASLIVTDKSTGFYLEENFSIVVTSGTSNGLVFTVSYEEIS